MAFPIARITDVGRFWRVGGCLLGVLVAAPARAADAPEDPDVAAPSAVATADEFTALSLEELMEVEVTVVAAGRREQTQRQAAASVSVVKADEINLMGYRNLAELLRNQRSFYLHTDGLNWFAGVRGLLRPGEWNARLLVLVDGRPTREVIYGQTHLDQDFVLPIEAYKRVEIIRGPGSSLYGSNAVFGVVNVVTKDGADLNGGLVRLQGGQHETARAVGMYGFTTDDGWDIIGGASGHTSQGEQSIHYDGIGGVENNFGRIEDWDDERTFSGFLKVKRGPITAMIDHADRERDSRSATYGASFYAPGTMQERRTNLTLRFDHEFSPGHSLHAMAYYGYYKYDQDIGYELDPPGGPDKYIYYSRAADDWLGQEIHYSWQVSPKLHLLAGAEATQAIDTLQHDSDNFGYDDRIDESYNAWALFTEANWQATDNLTLVAGARFDRVQDVGNHFNPRAGAILDLSEADTLKLLYGRAFRAPNLYEMFYDVGGYAGNPDLESEVVDTYEVVWERRFASGWETSVGAFLWQMSDAMADIVLPNDDFQVQNVGTVEARGVELELRRRWDTGAMLRTYTTFTDTESPDGEQLAISPQWIVGAAVIVPVLNRNTFLALDTQLVGPMESDLGQSTDTSYVTNVILTSREFLGVEGLEFQAGVYNLFADDARLPHGDSFLHAQPTLNWPETRAMVGLTYRF